jgi:hypothetical protein
MTQYYASRLCAVCDRPIAVEFRLCGPCRRKWTGLEHAEWLQAMIEEATQDYNYRVRSYGRLVPLEYANV